MCKIGSGAGKCAGAKSNTVRRRSNHARTEDQAGREKRANTDAEIKLGEHNGQLVKRVRTELWPACAARPLQLAGGGCQEAL